VGAQYVAAVSEERFAIGGRTLRAGRVGTVLVLIVDRNNPDATGHAAGADMREIPRWPAFDPTHRAGCETVAAARQRSPRRVE
jgi:hypothetical protein